LGRQAFKQLANWQTFVHDFIQYAAKTKHLLDHAQWQEATKTILANKDNSCSIVYMYSLLCVFVSQYSSKVDDY